jgi:predicted RNA-binding Zn-ribbon protein involved in translation (DUF1610 family)
MVEICPKCASVKVSSGKETKDGRITMAHYRCDDCGHEWGERRL